MFIRKLLMQIFGFPAYLRIISFVFLRSYFSHIYLGEHKQVRYLSKLIKEGQVCIDIGANLGYFSLPLSHLVGARGKVYSVEPVKIFREVLERNIAVFGLGNAEVLPYALGELDGQEIQMATPVVDGVVRHGRTEVVEGESNRQVHSSHTAVMRSPQSLFGELEALHFIKCDVEGYETKILPQLLPIIERFHPILEIEIDPLEHKKEIIELLTPLGYQPFFLADNRLQPFSLSESSHLEEIELYFLLEEHLSK